MSTPNRKIRVSFEKGALRSAFRSLFWVIFSEKKKSERDLTLTQLAKKISSSKHEVSRWFNGDPNWTLNTVASLADALDVEIEIKAKDRKTGAIYTPAGIQVVTVSHPIEHTKIGFTRSAPIMRTVTLMRVPADTPANVAGFESAAA